MNLVCNIVYVYKICEKFSGCRWSFSGLSQSNPVVWHLHCVCVSVIVNSNESTGSLNFGSLVDSNGNKKDSSLIVILYFPVVLLQSHAWHIAVAISL